MYNQPPGYTGQPPAAPPEGGLYPQPGTAGAYPPPPNYNQPPPPNYNQPPANYGPPPPPQPQHQQPQPPPYTTATQQTFIQQPVSTITTVQPMMPTTNTVVIQQQQRKPENYMVMAVLVTFFCNCPLGTLAWIFSCLSDGSYNEGNMDEARKRGRVAMWLSIAGIITTVIIVIAIPVALVTAIGGCEHWGNNFYNNYGCYSCRKCVTVWNSGWDKKHCVNECAIFG